MDQIPRLKGLHILRAAILVCAGKAPITAQRRVLRSAGYWPPSVGLEKVDAAIKALEKERTK